MRRALRVLLLLGVPVLTSQVPEPEVFSALGKAFRALPDVTRTIEKADQALAADSSSADLLIAAAQARDAVLRFSESIPLYTRGMDEFPNDVRFAKLRGHRFLSTRRFDMAIVDLRKAVTLAPASFDVSYHLALAHYLRGDFGHAAREYQRCLAMSTMPRPQVIRGLPADWRSCYAMNDDTRVAAVKWAWLALRRSGKQDEAAKLLGSIHPEMTVSENHSYFRTLLLYKGVRSEGQTFSGPQEGTARPTIGYGVGAWHWLEGRKDQACFAWENVVAGENWAAFGFIAAEAEIARGACKLGNR